MCHFWFNTFFLVDSKMQFILSNYNEKHPESNLGILNSCLIPEFGHKHLYTMTKKDIDGLHKDKFHRLVPASFAVSVLFPCNRLYFFQLGHHALQSVFVFFYE